MKQEKKERAITIERPHKPEVMGREKNSPLTQLQLQNTAICGRIKK